MNEAMEPPDDTPYSYALVRRYALKKSVTGPQKSL